MGNVKMDDSISAELVETQYKGTTNLRTKAEQQLHG